MQQANSGFGNDWYDATPSKAALVKRNNKAYKTMLAYSNKTQYPYDAPCITVIKPVNKLFADAVDYQNYFLTKE